MNPFDELIDSDLEMEVPRRNIAETWYLEIYGEYGLEKRDQEWSEENEEEEWSEESEQGWPEVNGDHSEESDTWTNPACDSSQIPTLDDISPIDHEHFALCSGCSSDCGETTEEEEDLPKAKRRKGTEVLATQTGLPVLWSWAVDTDFSIGIIDGRKTCKAWREIDKQDTSSMEENKEHAAMDEEFIASQLDETFINTNDLDETFSSDSDESRQVHNEFYKSLINRKGPLSAFRDRGTDIEPFPMLQCRHKSRDILVPKQMVRPAKLGDPIEFKAVDLGIEEISPLFVLDSNSVELNVIESNSIEPNSLIKTP